VRSHAQPGRSPACKKAAVWFFDRGYKLPLLPAGSMTTTSFFCRKKALWPFPPITLPRPEPFVNPAPQILQLLCRAARLCATVPTSAVVFRQIPPLFRRPGPSMIMVQRGSGQRRPGSQSRRRRCDRRCEQRRPVQRLCAPRPDLTQPLNKSESPCPFRHLPGWTGGFCMKEKT
jgi:hypothetical protein